VPFSMGFCKVSQPTFSQHRGHLSSLCYLLPTGLAGGLGLSWLVVTAPLLCAAVLAWRQSSARPRNGAGR
jgi:hypothetical protein